MGWGKEKQEHTEKAVVCIYFRADDRIGENKRQTMKHDLPVWGPGPSSLTELYHELSKGARET